MKQVRAHGENGSALIEAAIVFPILSLLIAGTIQFGYAYGILLELKNASAVAARAAVLGTQQSTSQVCAAARSAIKGMIDSTQVLCETTPASLPPSTNTAVTITLTYAAPILGGDPSFGSGTSWTLRAQTTMQ